MACHRPILNLSFAWTNPCWSRFQITHFLKPQNPYLCFCENITLKAWPNPKSKLSYILPPILSNCAISLFLKISITKSSNLWSGDLLVCESRPNKINQWELSTSSRLSSFCPRRCVTHYRLCVTQQQHAKLQHSLNISEPYSKEPCQSTLFLCQCTIMSSSRSMSLHSPLFIWIC